MISEPAFIWYVPANDRSELAILVKVPTPSLKALISGCTLKLLFGIDLPFLCTGAMIFDVPDVPIIISGVQRDAEEHEALVRFLSDRCAMQETGAFFHLLDLQEFITLLKGSSGNSALFDYNLMERCKLFLDTKSVFIRSQPSEK